MNRLGLRTQDFVFDGLDGIFMQQMINDWIVLDWNEIPGWEVQCAHYDNNERFHMPIIGVDAISARASIRALRRFLLNTNKNPRNYRFFIHNVRVVSE